MRRVSKSVCAVFAVGVLAIGCAGCAAQSTGTAAVPNGTDNSVVTQTSANTGEEKTFDTVSFGKYQGQDIEWLKLSEQDGKTLLISKDVLAAMPFNEGTTGQAWSTASDRPKDDVEWADCSLRTWLNGDFMKTAFSAEEQKSIQATENSDVKLNAWRSASDFDEADVAMTTSSTDNVFLLSRAEAMQYFPSDISRKTGATDYALKQGVYTGSAEDSSGVVWWLRTNGYYSGYTSVVADDGYIHADGYRSDGELHDGFPDHGKEASEFGGNMGVRPCIWVDSAALA